MKLRRLGTRLLLGVAGADLEEARAPGDILEGLKGCAVVRGMYKLDFLMFRLILSRRRCRLSSFGLRVESLNVFMGLVACFGDSQLSTISEGWTALAWRTP